MRTLTTAAAAFIAVGITACSSGTPATAPPPSLPVAEQQAITAMTAHCTQDSSQIESMVDSVHTLEVKNGITDETMSQLAGHLETAVSVYKSKVSCVQPFAAYLTMREGG